MLTEQQTRDRIAGVLVKIANEWRGRAIDGELAYALADAVIAEMELIAVETRRELEGL